MDDLANRAGNDQLKAIFDAKDQLTKEIGDWRKRKELIAKREPRWRDLKKLLDHGADLPIAATVRPEIDAIEQNRCLLADPDPTPGLVDRLTQALRNALNEVHCRCKTAYQGGLAALDAASVWQRIAPDQQKQIIAQHQLEDLPGIAVGSTEEVLNTLNATKLREWSNLCDALPTRFANALAAAAKLLEPKARSIKLPGGTITGDDDLKAWLGAVEQCIREKLKDGPVIV